LSLSERIRSLKYLQSQNYFEKYKSRLLKLRDFIIAPLTALLFALIIKIFVFEAYKIPTGSMENTLLVGDFLLVNKFIYGSSSPRAIPFTNIKIPYFTIPAVRQPERGDVVVFEYPGARDEIKPNEPVIYIKRLTALPGDTVSIVNKKVYINGRESPCPQTIQYKNHYVQPPEREDTRIFPKGTHWNKDNYGPLVIPKKGDSLHLDLNNIEQWRVIINRELNDAAVKVTGHEITISGRVTKSYKLKKDYYFMMGDNRDDSFDSRFWGFVSGDKIIGKGFIVYWSWDPSYNNIIDRFATLRPGRIGKIIR